MARQYKRRPVTRRGPVAPAAPSIMDPAVIDPTGYFARVDARRDAMPDAPLDGEPAVVEARFRFPAPAPVASINQVDGWHWAQRAAHRAEWRQRTAEAADRAADFLAPFRGYRVRIQVAFPVKDPGRRRDPHNYSATMKPLLDGITDAQVLWPDDTGTWVDVAQPVFWNGPDVIVRLTATPPAWQPSREEDPATVLA